jgi:Mg2+ and Co2+ transporter CorA
VYFRDVYDHIVRLNETIDAQRELLTTALEAHLSIMSHAQNEHMKRITAWAAMIAVPTMIAGIYGMNFRNMPELSWSYGYYVSIGVMAAACRARGCTSASSDRAGCNTKCKLRMQNADTVCSVRIQNSAF